MTSCLLYISNAEVIDYIQWKHRVHYKPRTIYIDDTPLTLRRSRSTNTNIIIRPKAAAVAADGGVPGVEIVKGDSR